jgi:HTH-type transcriptional regulator / antitoxin HigA
MTIQPIHNDEEHQAALVEISKLMNSDLDTEEGDRLSALADVIESYEAQRYPMPVPSAREAILFRMDVAGIARDDLVASIGSIEQVNEILNGTAEITEQMAYKLHNLLSIPLDVLRPQSSSC